MATTVKYNNSTIATVYNQTKTLNTSGKWMTDNVTITDDGGSILVVDTQDSNGGTIRTITSKDSVTLQGQKQVNLVTSPTTVSPDSGYDGFSSVVVTDAQNRQDLTEPKDVDFIDFDGRLLYSYTAQQFASLSSLPANPTYPGLVAQGWNWTLADAKSYVAQYGALVVGQNYTTDDGKTRIYVTIPKQFVDAGRGVQTTLYATQTGVYSYVVDWGDSTSPTTAQGSGIGIKASTPHIYQNPGSYVVKITIPDGQNLTLGHIGSNQSLFGNTFDDDYIRRLVTKVEIGDNIIQFGRQPFARFINLESVSVPVTCNSMDTGSDMWVFEECFKLKCFVFPSGIEGKDKNMFPDNQMKSLKYVSVPKTMTKFQMGTYPNSLRKLTLPPQSPTSVTYLPIKFYRVGALTHLVIPGTYTSILDDAIRSTYLKKLTIPSNVSTFSGTATLNGNSYLEELHMQPTTPPYMGYENCIKGGPSNRIIYVPYSSDHSILNAYKTATNWSTYASQMQEEPQ